LIEGLANDVDRNEAIDRDTASPMELQTAWLKKKKKREKKKKRGRKRKKIEA
jgi:hypothetical protein